MSRVGVVSVHYYSDYLRHSLAAVSAFAARAGAQRLIAVANRPELLPAMRGGLHGIQVPRRSCELHDNSGQEFGAYQLGLSMLLDADLDWVVFINDTFSIHYSFSPISGRNLVYAVSKSNQTAQGAGQIDSMAGSYSIQGMRTHRWLRTCIFALNRPALRLLGDRVYAPEISALVRASPNIDEFFSPRLDRAITEHLANWLFTASNRYAWYRAEALSDRNAEVFASKARSILQEKYLSAVLENAGAEFIEIRGPSVPERIAKRYERTVSDFRLSLLKRRLKSGHSEDKRMALRGLR